MWQPRTEDKHSLALKSFFNLMFFCEIIRPRKHVEFEIAHRHLSVRPLNPKG